MTIELPGGDMGVFCEACGARKSQRDMVLVKQAVYVRLPADLHTRKRALALKEPAKYACHGCILDPDELEFPTP